jgi:hypothetical protein
MATINTLYQLYAIRDELGNADSHTIQSPIDLGITHPDTADAGVSRWSAGTYNTGDIRIHEVGGTDYVYYCLADSNDAEPSGTVEGGSAGNWRNLWVKNSGWLPIGTSSASVKCAVNGNNNIISNLYIYRPASQYIGLFGSGDFAEVLIQNLHLRDVDITGRNNVGALMGENPNANNCSATGTVTGAGTDTGSHRNVGGLAGTGSSLSGCYTNVSVFHAAQRAGGLLGLGYGTITNCYSLGSVTRTGGTGVDFNAFIGLAFDATIQKCWTNGSVTYDGASDPTTAGFTSLTGTSTAQDNFIDTTVSNQNSGGGATGKTTAEMRDIDTFTNTETVGLTAAWDIVLYTGHDGEEATAAWFIDDSVDYPRLWYEYEAPEEYDNRIYIKLGGVFVQKPIKLKSDGVFIP